MYPVCSKAEVMFVSIAFRSGTSGSLVDTYQSWSALLGQDTPTWDLKQFSVPQDPSGLGQELIGIKVFPLSFAALFLQEDSATGQFTIQAYTKLITVGSAWDGPQQIASFTDGVYKSARSDVTVDIDGKTVVWTSQDQFPDGIAGDPIIIDEQYIATIASSPAPTATSLSLVPTYTGTVTVDVDGVTVTLDSGDNFPDDGSLTNGAGISINGIGYPIQASPGPSSTVLTLDSPAPPQVNAPYSIGPILSDLGIEVLAHYGIGPTGPTWPLDFLGVIGALPIYLLSSGGGVVFQVTWQRPQLNLPDAYVLTVLFNRPGETVSYPIYSNFNPATGEVLTVLSTVQFLAVNEPYAEGNDGFMGPFVSRSGGYYVILFTPLFGPEGSPDVPIPPYLTVFKSTDGGKTWSEQDPTHRPEYADPGSPPSTFPYTAATGCFSQVQDGNKIRIVRFKGSGTYKISLATFDMGTDTWSADVDSNLSMEENPGNGFFGLTLAGGTATASGHHNIGWIGGRPPMGLGGDADNLGW